MELGKIIIISLLVVFVTTIFILNYFSIFRTKKYTIDFHGTAREYLLHLPASYNSSNKYALLMVLHGYGDQPRFIEIYSELSRKSDTDNFIVVYPYGTKNDKTQKLSWNAGSCCGEALIRNIDDVSFINKLVDHLVKKYKIDTKRIYLTGFSNGALLSYRIASETPDKFAAVAIVAGSIGGRLTDREPYYYIPQPKTPMPIIIMHGQKDGQIIFNGGLNNEKSATFVSVRDSANFWIKNNNAKKEKITNEPLVIHEVYKKSNDNGASVELYFLKESSHVWFGSIMEIKNKILGKSIPASDLILSFFKENRK